MGEVILTMKDIDKSFPGVHALDHVNFDLSRPQMGKGNQLFSLPWYGQYMGKGNQLFSLPWLSGRGK